jgi:hypothetical protein
MNDLIERNQFHIRPFGVGIIDEHRQVQDYELIGFAITNDPA